MVFHLQLSIRLTLSVLSLICSTFDNCLLSSISSSFFHNISVPNSPSSCHHPNVFIHVPFPCNDPLPISVLSFRREVKVKITSKTTIYQTTNLPLLCALIDPALTGRLQILLTPLSWTKEG